MPNKKKVKDDNSEKREKFFKIGMVVITIVFVYIIYRIFNMVILKNERINLSGENYYQYFYGIKEEYGGKINLVKNNKATQLILENNKVVNLDSTPIFYKDVLGKVLLPSKMAIILPMANVLYKTEDFSNIIEENGYIYTKKLKGDKKKELNNAFIFDGNDLYFFLEETVVHVGDQIYTLSPLSYAIVNYRQNVEIYNYDKDEYVIISEDMLPLSDIIATNRSESYTINMSVDSFSTGSTDQLLIKNVDYLTNIDY